jgi:hypothetical protein
MLASVASGTTLAVAGAVTVTMVRRRAELPLALLPLLFGLQQLVEAVVWWSLEHDAAVLNNASTFTYMLFSHVWWPVFVPLTFLCIETVSWRRKVLSVFAAIGSGVAVQGLYTVLSSVRPPQGFFTAVFSTRCRPGSLLRFTCCAPVSLPSSRVEDLSGVWGLRRSPWRS